MSTRYMSTRYMSTRQYSKWTSVQCWRWLILLLPLMLVLNGGTAPLAQASTQAPATLLPTTGAAVPELAVFDETMQQFMRERSIEAGTLAISRQGVVLFKRGYGWKDRTLQTPVQPDTLMRLASLDKILTAAAVKRLIAEGQLSATTKVFPFLHITPPPAQTPDARLNAITVQHLLDHQGGWDAQQAQFDPMFEVISIAQALGIRSPAALPDIARYMAGQPLQFSPGTRAAYANFGFALLKWVVEQVSGQTLPAYMQTEFGLDVDRSYAFPQDRNPREIWYSDPYTCPNVFAPATQVPCPDGGFNIDMHVLTATSATLADFLTRFWISGDPRLPGENGYRYLFFGGVPGTFTVIYQRPDGVNIAALFNQRTDPSGLSYDNIIQMFDAAADSVTEWPTTASCNALAFDEASLNRAIDCVNAAGAGTHTISVTHDISFTQPSPLLTNPDAKQVVIEGNGHTIDAQGHGRVLALYKSKVDMRNLTLRGGRLPKVDTWPNPNYGGGLYADTENIGFEIEPSCALTLTNVVLTDNQAYAGGGLYYSCELPLRMSHTTISNNRAVFGGAFSTAAGEEYSRAVFVNSSTFSGNEATSDGGAFALANGDGGIFLQLVNSTVSGNHALSGSGGGLFLTQDQSDGSTEVQVINSTIANNTATAGSGVYNLYGSLEMSNSLIAHNNGASNCMLFTSEDNNGQLISNGHNLDSDGTCLPADVRQPSDIANGNANLDALADNGGATLTHALLPGSQAIDTGNDAVCVADPVNGVDQRGVARPQGAHCDIGAYEAAAQATGDVIFVSATSSGKAGDVKFRDEDILAYDPSNNTWLTVFDGSDVGVTKDVDAFNFQHDGSLLLSFNAPTDVAGVGHVDDSDILRFTPTALGDHTAGTFAWVLHGVDVGLATAGEDIDAIGFTADGHLVVSTIGNFAAPTATGRDEDLFQLDNATFGNPSSGTWSQFFDGSAVGLANEDVNGLWIDPAQPELYLKVKDSFSFAGQPIDSNDIFICTLSQAGNCTYRLFWDGDQHGYSATHLDGVGIGALPPTFVAATQDEVTGQATDEDTATDDDVDDRDVPEENSHQLFLPLIQH